MTKKKKLILTLILSILFYQFLWVFDPFLGVLYDVLTQQSKVEEFSENEFKWIDFQDLPPDEKKKYENGTCAQFDYSKSKFIQIRWFQRYKNIIGNVRVYHLLTPDRLIKNRVRIPNLNKTQYLLIDPKVMMIYQKLLKELGQKGWNTAELKITSGFRNPEYNKVINGATCSQHQLGTALDVSIGDLNNDGIEDKADRKLVYDILENQLIKDNGGLGKYKNHPKLIHFDTRGHRARW